MTDRPIVPLFTVDAPMEVKTGREPRTDLEPPQDGEAPTVGASVTGPGRAPTVGAGGRRARRAAEVGGAAYVGARHSWIPTGPRNVAGRVRSMVIHPADPRIMYAVSAAGGVWKTVDGAESWFPLWHDEQSLGMAAIDICAGTPATVWAATGEIATGGGERYDGVGVFRSTNNGETWTQGAMPGAAPPVGHVPAQPATRIDAIAADPTNPLICWAVGPAGVFRTLDGGASWTQFQYGVYYSDVVFSQNAAGNRLLFLVRAVGNAGTGVVVRLDNPAAADPAILAVLPNPAAPATQSALPAAGQSAAIPIAGPRAFRGKFATSASNRDVGYVVYANTTRRIAGVFRCTTLRQANFSTTAWAALPRHPNWVPDGQGEYNLAIAVSPANVNHLAIGLVGAYLSRNANAPVAANVNWQCAIAWELFPVDRGHHGDQHRLVFAQLPGAAAADPPALWVANDGGISVSTDWSTTAGHDQFDATGAMINSYGSTVWPVPPGRTTWRQRAHGISASQMYDLTQHPSIASLYGCGFQDNGAFISTGGDTWHFVLAADGGFVAWDPDDPYHFLATWQGGINEARFVGRAKGQLPTPGDSTNTGRWPRGLFQGFLSTDGPAFVAETVHHPRRYGRALNARMNRLYRTTAGAGDTWSVANVGRVVELIYAPPNPVATIEILPSPGALHLGLPAQVCRVDNPGGRATARIVSLRGPAFALEEGDRLLLRLDGVAAAPIVFRSEAGGPIRNVDRATAAEIAAAIRAAPIANLEAWPSVGTPARIVTLSTTAVGAAQRIAIGGTTNGQLFQTNRTYRGAADRPAVVALFAPAFGADLSPIGGPPVDRTLTVAVNGGAVRTVTFNAPLFPAPQAVRAAALARALRVALDGDPVHVSVEDLLHTVRLTVTGAGQVTLGGTAVASIWPAGAPAAAPTVRADPSSPVAFSMQPAPGPPVANLTLTIGDGTNTTPVLTFAPGSPQVLGIADLRAVTPDELRTILAGHIATHNAGVAPAARVRVRVDMETIVDEEGHVEELSTAPSTADAVAAGDSSGLAYVSADFGETWRTFGDAPFVDRDHPVEAIAIHPADPTIILVGLQGRADGPGDPGFLWRTTDGGDRWNHVGGELRDAAGLLVGINALEYDSVAPLVVFAATDVGVWRSTDGGLHWSAFNEGLPNCYIRDLAYVPATRTLRAGAWGRGAWSRYVGDTQPPLDVSLYLRASSLDDGAERPPRLGPEPLAGVPAPAHLGRSPDVKLTRSGPALGARIDGVEFDELIHHDEVVLGPAGISELFVQVHNRGAFPSTSVRVVAMWAPVDLAPPPLPAAFWTALASGPIPAGAVHGSWRVIGDGRVVDGAGAALAVGPADPQVIRFAGVMLPADAVMNPRVGILALVTSDDHAIAPGATDVTRLLEEERRAAYRVSDVLAADADARFVLTALGVPFTLAAPAAPLVDALGLLGLVAGGPLPVAVAGPGPYNLAGRGFTVTSTRTVTVAFEGPPDIPNLAATSALEAFGAINQDLFVAGVPVRAEFFRLPPPGGQWTIALVAYGEATLALTGGTAAANLGLATGPGHVPRINSTIPPTYGLAAGAPQTLTLQVTNRVTIAFTAGVDGVPNPAAVTAAQARRLIARRLAEAGMDITVAPATLALSVRRSPTATGGQAVNVVGGQLADLVSTGTAATPVADRPGLFRLATVLGTDRLVSNQPNNLYLRSSNGGARPLPGARHRLWQIDPAATPLAPVQIGAAVNTDLPAGGSAISPFTFNPGNVPAGTGRIVLAICDDPATPLEPPASLPNHDALWTFCETHQNAAIREFLVG